MTKILQLDSFARQNDQVMFNVVHVFTTLRLISLKAKGWPPKTLPTMIYYWIYLATKTLPSMIDLYHLIYYSIISYIDNIILIDRHCLID